jgi:hypothetical protein
VEASQRVQDSTQNQPVTDGYGSSSDDDDPQEEQETSIAAGRQRRQIRPPQRYGYADLVAYALYCGRGHWQSKSLPLIQKLSQVVSLHNGLLP